MISAAAPEPSVVDRFRREGFLVVRGLCPARRVEAMLAVTVSGLEARQAPLELEAEVGYPGAPVSTDAPGGKTVRRLKGALDRDPAFRDWAVSPALLAWVRALLEDPDVRVVRAHHNCVMTKHPGFSSATGWHQDTRYWSFQRPGLVNAWTALSVEAERNGGMRLVPGSHRMHLPAEAFDEARFFRPERGDFGALMATVVQAELEPGDVLFFDAGMLHAAGRNETDERKFSVVFSYRAASNRALPGTRSAGVEDLDPDPFLP